MPCCIDPNCDRSEPLAEDIDECPDCGAIICMMCGNLCTYSDEQGYCHADDGSPAGPGGCDTIIR